MCPVSTPDHIMAQLPPDQVPQHFKAPESTPCTHCKKFKVTLKHSGFLDVLGYHCPVCKQDTALVRAQIEEEQQDASAGAQRPGEAGAGAAGVATGAAGVASPGASVDDKGHYPRQHWLTGMEHLRSMGWSHADMASQSSLLTGSDPESEGSKDEVPTKRCGLAQCGAAGAGDDIDAFDGLPGWLGHASAAGSACGPCSDTAAQTVSQTAQFCSLSCRVFSFSKALPGPGSGSSSGSDSGSHDDDESHRYGLAGPMGP